MAEFRNGDIQGGGYSADIGNAQIASASLDIRDIRPVQTRELS
jgi:hypothetical protein